MKSEILANILYYIHNSLIIFIFIGNFIIKVTYLPYFTILIVLIMLDWNDIDGMCTLTTLEYYFRNGVWSSQPAVEENAPEFFRPFIKKITGIELSRLSADRLNNFIFLFILLISLVRIFISYKN